MSSVVELAPSPSSPHVGSVCGHLKVVACSERISPWGTIKYVKIKYRNTNVMTDARTGADAQSVEENDSGAVGS